MTRSVVGLDLDGVLWRGTRPVDGSARAVAALRDAGVEVAFLTNNANPTIGDYVTKMAGMGIDTAPGEIVTSAQAAARLLERELVVGDRVHVCGGPGLVEAVSERGLTVVTGPPASAVVVGYDPGFDYEALDRASAAVRDGALFVATNVDATFPSGDRLLPGNGALVAAVAAAGGAAPEVAGKPEAPYADLVRERFGPTGVMVGDRPSTDGALADVLGWPFALVLSGVAGSDGEEPVPEPAPSYLADDLAALVPVLLDAFARPT
ncbi:MAG: HAD-IIA family hydrolase [Acidimicrobiia bacterium]